MYIQFCKYLSLWLLVFIWALLSVSFGFHGQLCVDMSFQTANNSTPLPKALAEVDVLPSELTLAVWGDMWIQGRSALLQAGQSGTGVSEGDVKTRVCLLASFWSVRRTCSALDSREAVDDNQEQR